MKISLVEPVGYGIFVGPLHALQFTRSALNASYSFVLVAKSKLRASGRIVAKPYMYPASLLVGFNINE
jgi:hypothetical protein